jgi:uncharacterized protein YjbI with pentapeptide repeats
MGNTNGANQGAAYPRSLSYMDLDEIPLMDETFTDSDIKSAVDEYPFGVEEDDPEEERIPIHNARTTYTDLEGMNRPYSSFQRKHMPFVNISSSELPNGNFEMANMVCASICLSHLQGSNFRYADLEYTEIVKSDLSSADLSHAILRGATMKDCDLRWADLRGADLSECSIYSCRLQNALIDEHTILPFSKAQAKKMGMVLVTETSKAAG